MDVEKDNDIEQADSLNIGELLSQARENLGLDSSDIAKDLHLAPEIIQKLEANEFEQEFPAAFIRGYVKSYATKVGLNVGAILAEFDRQTKNEMPSLKRKETISTFNTRRKEINSNSFLFKSISAVIVLVFLVFAGWELWERFIVKTSPTSSMAENEIPLNVSGSNDLDLAFGESVTDSEEPISESVESDSALESELVFEPKSNIDNDTNSALLEQDSKDAQLSVEVQVTEQIEEALPVSQPMTDVEMTNANLTELVLDFSAECWVEIVDARGEVIAIGVKKPGKHMPVRGVAPFNVVLGDPSAVTMSYAGSDYDLSSYRAGRRAEIILN